jgi:hypothetical protein
MNHDTLDLMNNQEFKACTEVLGKEKMDLQVGVSSAPLLLPEHPRLLREDDPRLQREQ